jgi:hypothetical protein
VFRGFSVAQMFSDVAWKIDPGWTFDFRRAIVNALA